MRGFPLAWWLCFVSWGVLAFWRCFRTAFAAMRGYLPARERSVVSHGGRRGLSVHELVGDQRQNVAQALLQYPLWDVDLPLAAAKVVSKGRGWIETQMFANQIPPSLQVLGATRKFEIIHVDAEKQSQLLVYKDTFPAF